VATSIYALWRTLRPHADDPNGGERIHLLVIGGSDAGIAAALRAREVDDTVDVTVVVADGFPNFSICGLPFWLGGEVEEWKSLAHRTQEDLQAAGVDLRLNTAATGIDPSAKRVELAGEEELSYDRLVIGTGAEPLRPPLPGLDLPGVHLLHTMDDAFALAGALNGAESAAIIGAGYIGLEMAEALAHRRIEASVIEQLPEVLATVDPTSGALAREQLVGHGVEVRCGVRVEAIEPHDERLRVVTDSTAPVDADVVLVSVGVRPASELAAAAGAELGVRGAIAVDRGMATSLPYVWAAGDCVHTHHRLLPEPGYLPLGTTAHKQGRVAGENAVGGEREFAGSLGTQVVRLFDWAFARTGLKDDEARAAGYAPLTVEAVAPDHKAYYPGAHDVHMRFTGDALSGRLLGCQLGGHRDAQVAKRIDIPASALFDELSVDQLSDLDLAYTPPFGSPWDALQVGAQAWETARRQSEPSAVSTAGRPSGE
jgi:NADPH-dependent 2,4-dienoyl-CoA reductase/sulfur reductase-like enzyme